MKHSLPGWFGPIFVSFAALAKDAAEPHLLAWTQQDEPDRTGQPSTAAAATLYASLRAAAPNIPVFMNFSGFAVLGKNDSCNGPGDHDPAQATDTCYPSY